MANQGIKLDETAQGALSGAMMGASLGSIIPGPGTLIGAGVGALAGGLNAHLNSDAGKATKSTLDETLSFRNIFAMGGDTQYQNGGDTFSTIDNGGTHEQNPNGGVPLGNTGASVEEGETKMGSRVFSNRLINPNTGNTFADDSKKFVDSRRPNDPISKRYTEKQLDELFQTQEAMKPTTAPQQEQQFAFGGDMFNTAARGALNLTTPQLNGTLDRASLNALDLANRTTPQLNGTLDRASLNALDLANRTNVDFGQATPEFNYETQGLSGLPQANINRDINTPVSPLATGPANPLTSLDFAADAALNVANANSLEIYPEDDLPVYESGAEPFGTDTSLNPNSPTSVNKAGETIVGDGVQFSPLRYASLAGDAFAIGHTLANKPEEIASNAFNSTANLDPNLIDRGQLLRNITSSSGATREALRGATQGNAGAFLNSLQGLNTGTNKAIANATLQANIADQQELARTQQLGFRQDMFNQGQELQVKNINDANEAAYSGQLLDSTTNLAQNVGAVGTEQTNKSIVDNLYGYDTKGRYQVLTAEYEAEKKSGKTTLSFKQWAQQKINKK